jgi:hypothetical protein
MVFVLREVWMIAFSFRHGSQCTTAELKAQEYFYHHLLLRGRQRRTK